MNNVEMRRRPSNQGSVRPAEELRKKLARLEDRGNRCLADANEAAEQGKRVKAEKLYQQGQRWLDRANKMRGWGG